MKILLYILAISTLLPAATAATTRCRTDRDCPAYTGTIPNNDLICKVSIGLCLPRVCNGQSDPPLADKCSEYASQTFCTAGSRMCLSSIGAFQACSALDVNSCVPGFLCMPQEVNRDARWTCRPAPNPPSSPGSTTTSALASSPPTSTPNGNSDPSKNDAHTKPFQIALQFVIFASALATVYWLQKSRPVVATSTEAPPTYTAAPRSGEVVATATPIRSAGAADDIPLREIPAAASLGPIPVAPAEVTPKPPSYSR